MKHIKLIGIILLSIAFGISCNNKKAADKTVLTVDSLLQTAETLVDKTVTVEGLCTHVCTHSGKKLFLEGSDDTKSIRAESDKVFRQECINKKVSVTGKLVEERIDEAYLTNWENELKADTTKHGKEEGAGCATEKKAQGEKIETNTTDQRIADYRTRIAEEKAKTGKDYLSFYHIQTDSYRIVD